VRTLRAGLRGCGAWPAGVLGFTSGGTSVVERRTPPALAAGEQGRQAQSAAWQARRAARLAELGFADLAVYLQCRHVELGSSVRRIRAELRVGRCWLVGELARLGLWR
jgi:hypothetical protein